MIEYRFIKEEELTKELFKDFIRHQIVNDCCTEAQQYRQEHVEQEPYDCQLECDV